MANQNGIGYSPLTEKVYMGKQNIEKRIWVGEKKDITNQFIAVAFEYFEPNTTREIDSSNGMTNIFANVEKTEKGINKMIKHLNKLLKEINHDQQPSVRHVPKPGLQAGASVQETVRRRFRRIEVGSLRRIRQGVQRLQGIGRSTRDRQGSVALRWLAPIRRVEGAAGLQPPRI